jgi:protein TonB
MRMLCALLLSAVVVHGQDAPTVYKPGVGVTLPVVTKQVRAEYTAEAKRARIVGSVMLEGVVLPDGTVGDVRVERSLDTEHGLDQAAIDAFKHWLFKPGMKDGKPVAVVINIEMTFTLR